MCMPNVEFSHIIVDKGMLDDHMPDSVQDAVEHLYRQLLGVNANESNALPIPYQHSNNTEPIGLESDDIEVNEGAINTPDENKNRTEVTIHNTQEDNNTLLVGQEESTPM